MSGLSSLPLCFQGVPILTQLQQLLQTETPSDTSETSCLIVATAVASGILLREKPEMCSKAARVSQRQQQSLPCWQLTTPEEGFQYTT